MLFSMKDVIHFQITKGDTHYVASAEEFFIVTQGKTLDELMKNIKEAAELHLEVMHEDLAFADEWTKYPSLLMNYEIPPAEYAQA